MSQQKSLRKQLICFICLHVTLPSLGSELRFFAILKGVVCQLNEGDEFGKLALVNNALR